MLYRGMSPQLVGGALETGVNYAVYQAMLKWTQVLKGAVWCAAWLTHNVLESGRATTACNLPRFAAQTTTACGPSSNEFATHRPLCRAPGCSCQMWRRYRSQQAQQALSCPLC